MDFVGSLKHIPRKGETVLCESFELFCGGKGANQAIAVAKLGGQVAMIGCVGKDDNGKILKENLEAANVDATHVIEKNGPSGLAMIWVEGSDNRIVVAPNANFLIDESDIDKGLSQANPGDILIAQLETPLEIVFYAFKIAKGKGMITILNPAPAAKNLSQEFYHCTDIIALNETEAEILTGVNPIDKASINLAIKKLQDFGVEKVILTLGERGAVAAENQTITEIKGRKVKAIDTTAAGDTFVGAVAERLSAGIDFVSACEFANFASSITVQRKGAAISIPNASEVEKILSSEKT
jgi:ribokinase